MYLRWYRPYCYTHTYVPSFWPGGRLMLQQTCLSAGPFVCPGQEWANSAKHQSLQPAGLPDRQTGSQTDRESVCQSVRQSHTQSNCKSASQEAEQQPQTAQSAGVSQSGQGGEVLGWMWAEQHPPVVLISSNSCSVFLPQDEENGNATGKGECFMFLLTTHPLLHIKLWWICFF